MNNSNLDIWVAGAFAAVFVDFLVYPFDTVKTRIQSPKYDQIYKDSKTGRVKQALLFRGVYQGVWSVVLATIPSSGAFFTTYEAIKSSLSNISQDKTKPILPHPIIHSIASCTGELVSCFMLTPAEVLKQNAQVIRQHHHHNGPNGHATPRNILNTSSHVYPELSKTATIQAMAQFRRKPWKLWSGYTALVGRNLPSTGLNFPMFEYFRSKLIEHHRRRRQWRMGMHAGSSSSSSSSKTNNDKHTHDLQLLERAGYTGIAAGMSGTVVSVITMPIDVVKTRLMLAASHDRESGGNRAKGQEGGTVKPARKGAWAIGQEIYRQEGIRGLFRGGAIRGVWTALSLGLYMAMYEGGRYYLETRRNEKEGKGDRGEVGV